MVVKDNVLPHQRNFSTGLAWLILVLGVLLASCSGQGSDSSEGTAPSERASMTVTVETVGVTSMSEEMVMTGTVEAWQTLTVASELSGLKMVRVLTDIGDDVQAGTPLAYLDDRNLRAQLEAARARYKSAVANVSRTRRPDRPQQISALKAAVKQSKAMVAQEEANLAQVKINQASADRTAKRYSQALKEGYVTALETDQRVTDRNSQLASITAAEQRIEAAKYSLKQAQHNLRLAEAGGRAEDVAMAEAQRDEAHAAITQLQVQLDQCVITAPDSGKVLSQNAFLGNIASAGQELFTIARQGRLQLWAEVPQQDLESVRPGDFVQLESGGFTEEGTVEEVDPKINPSTRQGRVRIALGRGTTFRIGSFVRGHIKRPDADALVVSAEAIQGESNEEYIFLYQDGKAQKVELKLGRRQAEKVEVIDGLKQGQVIIVSGAAFLTDGDSVEVAKI